MLPPTLTVQQAAYYDVLDDWIFPNMATDSYVSPLVAQIWKTNNINFGSIPIKTAESAERIRKVMQARAYWNNLEAIRWEMEYRRRMKYINSGFFRWIAHHTPVKFYWFMRSSELLQAIYEFITSKTFNTILFTAKKVVSIFGLILEIYAAVNFLDQSVFPEIDAPDEFLDALRPLPFIDNAKTTLKVHYLPLQDVRTYPYNPQGRKRFTFPHAKQDVMDADLHRLGNTLKENRSVYKYSPELILYYEITCEVEFEVDLSA